MYLHLTRLLYSFQYIIFFIHIYFCLIIFLYICVKMYRVFLCHGAYFPFHFHLVVHIYVTCIKYWYPLLICDITCVYFFSCLYIICQFYNYLLSLLYNLNNFNRREIDSYDNRFKLKSLIFSDHNRFQVVSVASLLITLSVSLARNNFSSR